LRPSWQSAKNRERGSDAAPPACERAKTSSLPPRRRPSPVARAGWSGHLGL
jgi:hypothetical protein